MFKPVTSSLRFSDRVAQTALLFCALVVAGVSPSSLFAQASNAAGTIQGTVTDPSGAAVPSAKVTISEPSTGLQKVFTTSGSGYYSAGSLAPGQYKIQVDAPGFAGSDEVVTVQIGVVSNGDLKLGVGSSTTQIEVEADEVSVDTTQTQIAGVLSREQIANLPVNGRNFLDLAQLQPGVQIQDGTNFDPTKNGFSSISFGGRFGRTARILLDGLDISDENVGTTTQNISEDAIQEFEVAQSNLDISTSITSSGSVNVISRSGSNRIHGDGFYNFRDKRAGGANFPGGQDNYLQRNNVGGGFGGAFVPDKAFYFMSAERFIQHLDAPVNLSGTPFPQLSGSYTAPYSEMELLGRTDFNLPYGAHAFVRGAYHNNKDVGGFGGGNNYSPYLNENNTPNVGGGVDFVTGNFSHSFRVGYFKFFNHITDATTVTENPLFNTTPGVSLQIGAFSSGANYLAPQATAQSNKQFRYDGTWTKGRHTLRYGAGINHLLGGGFASFYGIQPYVPLDYSSYDPTNSPFAGGAANPANYIVNPSPAATVGVYLGNGQGYNTEKSLFGYPGGGQEDWRFTAYVGDQWKLTPRLNVNYGLRYIRDTGRNDSDLPAIPSLDAIAPGLGNKVRQPNQNFGPQAGISWDATGKGKTIVRAGAGIYYENNVWNNVLFDRPVRLSQGLFFGLATLCPNTTVPLPGGGTITSIDGVPLSSICGSPIGLYSQQLGDLEKAYQAAVTAAGPQANGNYINSALAVGPAVNGDQLFLPQYRTPRSYQMNIGVQQEIVKNVVVSVDYLRNTAQNFLLGIDENHAGDVSNFNPTAAAAAVATTVAACGAADASSAILACPGLHPATATTPVGGAVLGDFAANGLDSISTSNGGAPAANFAFAGKNTTYGQMSFLTPSGRSSYNALAVTVNGQAHHPVPGVISANLTASYTYSHFNGTGSNAMVGTGLSASGGDQDFGANALSYNNPNKYYGPNSLDRHQQFSIGLDAEVWKGLRIDTIAHLYSSLPLTLSLPTQGAGDIFISDLDGDGTVGDVVPGSNIGSFMRGVTPHNINNLITNYNNAYSGKLTPAGNALVNANVGISAANLTSLGAVAQSLPLAPANQLGNDILRVWDVGVGYSFKVGEGLSIQPSVHAFNVLNAANFDAPGPLGSVREDGVLNGQPGSANNTTAASQEPFRLGLGTGVFALGAPRQLEFGLKATF
ncbi:Oar protein [Acidisarcina polymorpha]|uniref:Oar protein n=1 Tax=Acidisarcina polymorpha TaxID=2211140 RepID=A0A2Z5FZ90_9BACT|nr:carboxypeptidase regulatory-like domain-containing protein [Acidisarcina polymorpha]AXC11676.1 Oar protein [Acidisarcina polymorpha]